MAVAAALATVLLITGIPDTVPDVKEAPVAQVAPEVQVASEVQVAAGTQVASDVQVAAGSQVASEAKVASEAHVASEVQMASSAENGTLLAATQTAAGQEPAASGDSPVPASAAAFAASGKSLYAQNTAKQTSFDFPDDDTEAKVRKMSISARGAMSGNNPSSSSVAKRSGGYTDPEIGTVTETSESSYSLPFSVGLGFKWRFSRKFALGFNLDYAYLQRKASANYTPVSGTQTQVEISQTLHYLELPVNVSYSFINSKLIDFYGYVGGRVGWCIANDYSFMYEGKNISRSEAVYSPQWSVLMGIGVQLCFTEYFGIFVDPEVNYYFPSGQPRSIRTDKPFMFNLSAGLRFTI